jgi:competence ComEA-like helix-hairpin-helix protein
VIDRELYREQLQAVLLLSLLILLFWLAMWAFSFHNSNSPIHMVKNVVGRHYAVLYFEPMEINSATMEELDLLPGVGQKTAQAILNLRQEHGFFLLDEELREAMAEAHLPRRHLNALVGCYLTAQPVR